MHSSHSKTIIQVVDNSFNRYNVTVETERSSQRSTTQNSYTLPDGTALIEVSSGVFQDMRGNKYFSSVG